MNTQKLKWSKGIWIIPMLMVLVLAFAGCTDDESTENEQYTVGTIEVAANSRSEGYSLDGLPVSYYQVRENKGQDSQKQQPNRHSQSNLCISQHCRHHV